jgi:hypothetical protein
MEIIVTLSRLSRNEKNFAMHACRFYQILARSQGKITGKRALLTLRNPAIRLHFRIYQV